MRLFRKKEKQTEQKKLWLEELELDTSSWFQVFSACLGKMLTVQTAFAEQPFRGNDWNVNFSKGVIRFADAEFPIQYLGSESSVSNTWLWGWKNVNGLSDQLLQVANELHEAGKRWKLEPLTVEKFTLDEAFNGHSLSIVACGLEEGYCYYRCPHSKGAAFVAVSGLPESVFAPVSIKQFVSTTMECIEKYHMDHKLFVEGFLTWNKTPFTWSEQTLTAHFRHDIGIQFEQVEEFWRIASFKGLNAEDLSESLEHTETPEED